MITDREKKAIQRGDGVAKNGRYFNTGVTFNSNGTVRFDFDARNKLDPAFTGESNRDGFINDYD